MTLNLSIKKQIRSLNYSETEWLYNNQMQIFWSLPVSLVAIKKARRNLFFLWDALPAFLRKTSKKHISIFLLQNPATSSELSKATKHRRSPTLTKTQPRRLLLLNSILPEILYILHSNVNISIIYKAIKIFKCYLCSLFLLTQKQKCLIFLKFNPVIIELKPYLELFKNVVTFSISVLQSRSPEWENKFFFLKENNNKTYGPSEKTALVSLFMKNFFGRKRQETLNDNMII